jgi:flagellar hook-associated protein 1 FlgK
MTGLLTLLGQSAGSLGATSAWTSTVSQNLTNANTPGYARQSANLAAVLPADMIGSSYLGMGSVLQSITQARDRFVEAQMSSALGNQSYSAAQTNALQSITSFDTGNGIGPAMSSFYSKLSALSQDPGSASLREAAVASASNLANVFNSTASELASTRTALDSQITGKLGQINSASAQIASLNLQIRQAKASGGSPNDLLDARQKLADQLSTLTGAHSVPNTEEDLNMVLPGGVALVSAGQAAVLSTQPDPANRGHVALYTTAPDGSGPSRISGQPGGELGGLFAARDGGLASAETSVDQLAFDFTNQLNTVHTAGYALDGTTGRALFNVSATSLGAAGSVSVNQAITANVSLLAASASAATVPGDHTNLQAMIDTQSQALSTGKNPTDTFSGITASYGTRAASAQAANEGDQAILKNVTSMRASVSGVSIDEEMISLQQAQRSYEAITKVISTANTMLDALMALR